MTKYVYSFNEGNKNMRELLGGKGANLAEMTNMGLPVPSGFVVTTEACNKYYEDGQIISDEVVNQIFEYIEKLEKATNKKFGDPENTLLVSVRSGSRASMPGMMDTILNLGLNDKVVEGMRKTFNNDRFVYDSYRRFIGMYADVVMGYSKESFEDELTNYKNDKNIAKDQDLTDIDLKNIVEIYKKNYEKLSGVPFPQDEKHQLIEAIKAVFRSWNNNRAIVYRRMHDIPASWGTAVNVQEMVYGNNGELSGTGVAFSRNPATGTDELYGEYMINAQGEDLVAGIRTPEPISKLKETMPEVYEEFYKFAKNLEGHYKDMQDLEFTIDNKKLYILQTRNGKRTINAAVKIATDLVKEKMISKRDALLSINANQLSNLLHPGFDEESVKKSVKIATGLPASPGAATGRIYFSASDIVDAKKRNEEVILVRAETSPEDIEGMNAANGILTIHGGMTSHAAVVARGMGKCCITGSSDFKINESNKTMITSNGITLKEGDYISLDGTTGFVYQGEVKLTEPVISDEFKTIMKWSNEIRRLDIYANADTEEDAKVALSFGAAGIGLCRTEHMFFASDRILEIRKMIIANTTEERLKALDKLLVMQRGDFESIFRVMKDLPVTIRFIDPPLHEFLPTKETDIKNLAKSLKINVDDLKLRIEELKEVNPMMGHRGCRLAVTFPEILKMQTRAIIEAAITLNKEGVTVKPELMIPLIVDIKELKYLIGIIKDEIDLITKEAGVKIEYKLGTMIETPRAAIIAHEIASNVDFFSFGTNDLTQLAYGFSRDDASKFLEDYYELGIFDKDPFKEVDEIGVGKLVEMSVVQGRVANSNLKLGICGEHGGEPNSIKFFNKVGLNYVSCSPYRIPIAKLAAAQAVLIDNDSLHEVIDVDIIEVENNKDIAENIEKCINIIKKYGFKIDVNQSSNNGTLEFTFKIQK